MYTVDMYPANDYRAYLEHHGIPGMRWGVRRYQNADGSLTAAGKKHQAKKDFKEQSKKDYDKFQNRLKKIDSTVTGKNWIEKDRKQTPLVIKASREYDEAQKNNRDRYRSELKSIKSEAKAERAAKRREKILNNPKLLKKHLNEYSDKEINDALKRFDQMQRLEGASRSRSKAGKVKKALAATVGTGALIVSGYNTAKNLYKIKKEIFG